MKSSGKRVQLGRWFQVKATIQKHGRINKWDLMDQVGMSRSVYEKESPFWLHKFPDFIEYDRKTSEWSWIVPQEPETEKIVLTTEWESEL